METCFHSHFCAFFQSFYGGQLKQQTCYSFILLISFMVFNPFEMAVQIFKTASSLPNFDGPNAFFPQIQQDPGPTSER